MKTIYAAPMDATEQQSLLKDLHGQIRRLASAVGAPDHLLPQSEKSPDGTWISLAWREAADGDDEDGWYLALVRNEGDYDWELAEVTADRPDYLLYVLFDEITSKVARATTQVSGVGDNRAEWFAEQEALLGRINEAWRDQTAKRHAEMLKII